MICEAADRKLVLPIEKIKQNLQAPIIELSKNERIRFTTEETGNYLNNCLQLVENLLSIEEIQRGPLLFPFLKLINNEQVIFLTFLLCHLSITFKQGMIKNQNISFFKVKI